MRSIEAMTAPASPTSRSKKTLKGEATRVLREDLVEVTAERDALRRKQLGHDQKVTELSRAVRSANEDAVVLLEAVSLLSRVVTSERREGRVVREQVRKLLESKKIPPPATLGSSRKRAKAKTKRPKTIETP